MFLRTIMLLNIGLAFFVSCHAQNNRPMSSDTSLKYVIRESKDSTEGAPMLILLHGHGSNEEDLFALNNGIPDDWIVVSVRGPYKLSENSYRWYDVRMDNGRIAVNIIEEEISRKRLMDLIGSLTKKYKADSSKILVAGFSQGANMAQSLGLGEPGLIAGFAVFSGRYVEEFTPYISKSAGLKNANVFISHGSGDKMLPVAYAQENISKLKILGFQITYCEDSNGHSISAKQWNAFSKWLLEFRRY